MSAAAAAAGRCEEEEDRKPVIKPDVHVTLKVVDQDQHLVRHTMKMTGKLQAVMDAYYHAVPAVAYGTGTFWFDAVNLRGDRTPADFEMEDGDVIDFFEQQVGGAPDA